MVRVSAVTVVVPVACVVRSVRVLVTVTSFVVGTTPRMEEQNLEAEGAAFKAPTTTLMILHSRAEILLWST